ncbi:MAG: hypothetical protein HQM00_14235, partial [Magnetococcales bacterium]|nr:hypothetical protein [Magnetococcales bacterium]
MLDQAQRQFATNQLNTQNARMADIRTRTTASPPNGHAGEELASSWGAGQRNSLPVRHATTDAQTGTGRFGDANAEIGSSIVAQMMGNAQKAYGSVANAGMQAQFANGAWQLANQNAEQIGASILSSNNFDHEQGSIYQDAVQREYLSQLADQNATELAGMNFQGDLRAQQAAEENRRTLALLAGSMAGETKAITGAMREEQAGRDVQSRLNLFQAQQEAQR